MTNNQQMQQTPSVKKTLSHNTQLPRHFLRGLTQPQTQPQTQIIKKNTSDNEEKLDF